MIMHVDVAVATSRDVRRGVGTSERTAGVQPADAMPNATSTACWSRPHALDRRARRTITGRIERAIVGSVVV
ncbi:MAG: hypothetical protein JNK05_25580 [Myxococcales bacterium]|nr:hypothetical protein [Myxococcales bacterium]